MNLRGHTDEALLLDVRGLIGSQRELTVRLIVYLAEIEQRRLHLFAGFSSMFEFCVNELGLSEGEAFRRLTAARLGRKFPVIHSLVASGEVHLSALVLLRPHLTDHNHAELLQAVRGKSKRDVEMLLATRFPRPDEPARIRSIASERFRIEFTASAGLREKLERCLDLSSHANPARDLGFVIERAVELLLEKLERERLGKAERPRLRTIPQRKPGAPPTTDSPGVASQRGEKPGDASASRHVSNADRRAVFERDGCRCTYVSPEGRRCGATAFLELDHIVPRALGGGSEANNLRVRCRAHNRLWAEQTFGRSHVERAVNFRQRKQRGTTMDTPFDASRAIGSPRRSTHETVIFALERLGFRPAQARSAVDAAEERLGAECQHALEAVLREALREATKAA